MEDITVQELRTKMQNEEKFILIDVREPGEYQGFNIGATLIPLGDFPSAIPKLEEHKNEEIIIHCRSGKRSDTAKMMLVQSGFTNVRNVLGGMLAWQEMESKDS